ncbi:MAG: heme-binding protein [Firmicutes bacterium]|nr:heme-binding protein [Bacillota bacterium]
MLEEMMNQQAGKYTKKDLETLEEQERILQFEHFTSQDAFELGKVIVECAPKYKEGIAINIQRCSDQGIIFQYMDDSKAERNFGFAKGKRNTVLQTGHNSLWALVKSVVDGKINLIETEEDPAYPVGGAYPIYVEGKMVATVALSGLHHGNDFNLLVEALSKYLGKEIPTFQAEIL